jgi:SM-20-related protein
MLSNYSAQNLDTLIQKINQYGFCIIDNFMPDTSVSALNNELTALKLDAQLHVAGTGRTLATMHNDIRGDIICWLNADSTSKAQQAYFTQMEALRLDLNQHFYLGLFALESHLAIFPAGTGYTKHLDQFTANADTHLPKRQISCIMYLNQNWLESDGGHLRLYLNSNNDISIPPPTAASLLDISPIGGRLVIFLSEKLHHAVLPATRDRSSLTGWFLTR